MLEQIELKEQSLKDYLKVNFNKGIYNFNHNFLKVEFGIEIKNLLDFFNSTYEISANFLYNYEELPFETNQYMIDLCSDVDDDDLIESSILMSTVNELIFYISEYITRKENGQEVVVDNGYILGNTKFWTYNKELNSLRDKAEKNISNRIGRKCHYFPDILEKLYGHIGDGYHNNISEIKELKSYFNSITRPTKANQKKQAKPILVNGNKLNISERYKIANEVCNIYGIIQKKNITATEKHILLAHIMGCSQQVARELFNGTQIKRTPIREDVVNSYLEKLK